MGLLDIANMLRTYAGVSAAAPPSSTQEDFAQAAQHAPQEHLASGLASAFQSNETPPFSQMIGQLFAHSNGQQQAGILNELLRTAGPSLGGNPLIRELSGLLGGATVTPQQAQQVSPQTVQKLAEHAQQEDPSVVQRAGEFYAQHPQLVQVLGASALALVMSHLSQKI